MVLPSTRGVPMPDADPGPDFTRGAPLPCRIHRMGSRYGRRLQDSAEAGRVMIHGVGLHPGRRPCAGRRTLKRREAAAGRAR